MNETNPETHTIRKGGRPKGSKNKPKVFDVALNDAVAMRQLELRAKIDAGRHIDRMQEIADQMAEKHRAGEWYARDESTSISIEIRLLRALCAKIVPDLAQIKTEAPTNTDAVHTGIVVLPEVTQTGHLPDKNKTKQKD